MPREGTYAATLTALAATLLLLFNGGMRPAPLAGLAAFAALLLSLAPATPASPLERRLHLFTLWFGFAALLSPAPRLATHQTLIVTAGLLAFLIGARAGDAAACRLTLGRLARFLSLFLAAGTAAYFLAPENTASFARFGAKFAFTLGHYNHMGTLLLLMLPLPRLLLGGPAAAAATFILLLLTFLTGSRGAAGLALLALAADALLSRRGAGRLRALAAAALAALLLFPAAAALNPEIRAKFTSGALALRTADDRGRDVIWRAGLSLAAEHPWIGAGPGRYPAEAPRLARGQLLDAHNLYLNLAAEAGLPALLLFLAALAAAFLPRAPEPDPDLARALKIGLAAALAQNLVAGTLFLAGGLAALFFLLLGLLDAPRRAAAAGPPRRALPLPTALAATLLLAALACRLGLAELNAFAGLHQARAGKWADARCSFERALALDPAHAVYRLNAGLCALRAGDPAAARADFRRAAATLPHCPITLSGLALLADDAAALAHLPAVERTGYADLLAAAPGDPAGSARGFLIALLENPRNAWSGTGVALLADPARCAAALEGLDPARLAAESPYPFYAADWLLYAGRLTAAVAVYEKSGWTAAAFREGVRDEDRRAGPGGVEKRLFDLAAAMPSADADRADWIAALRRYRDGGTLETALPRPPSSAEAFARRAALALLAGDDPAAAAHFAEAWRLNARVWHAPTPFTFPFPLVPDPRLLTPEAAPAAPAWLDDNFLFFPVRLEPLPLLADAVRRGGTPDPTLAPRLAAALLAGRDAAAPGFLHRRESPRSSLGTRTSIH